MENQQLFLEMIKKIYDETEIEEVKQNGRIVYRTELALDKRVEKREYRVLSELTKEMKQKYPNVLFIYEIVDYKNQSDEINDQWISMFYEDENCYIDMYFKLISQKIKQSTWLFYYDIYNKDMREVSKTIFSKDIGKELLKCLSKQPNYRLLFATGTLKIIL